MNTWNMRDNKPKYSVNTKTRNKREVMSTILRDYYGKKYKVNKDSITEDFMAIVQYYKMERVELVSARCVCSHPIFENCLVRSFKTDELFTVGNDCIRLFGGTLAILGVGCIHLSKTHKLRRDFISNFDTPFELMSAVMELMKYKFGKYHTYRLYKQKGKKARIYGVKKKGINYAMYDLHTDKKIVTLPKEDYEKRLHPIDTLGGVVSIPDAMVVAEVLDKYSLPLGSDFIVHNKYDRYLPYMPFGKYEDYSFEEIVKIDRDYANWVVATKKIKQMDIKYEFMKALNVI